MLEWARRLLTLTRRDRERRELDEELRAHYEELCEDLEADGHDRADAARLARLRLGGLLQTREAAADVWRIGRLEPWLRDTRLAWRALRRTPAFLAAAVGTLALGIGVTTAIVSVVHGVVFRPLPYPDSGRLIRIYETNLANNKPRHDVSVGVFSEWRASARTIASIALFSKTSTWYPAANDPLALRSVSVSPAFFDVLGVRPAAGRFFRSDRDYSDDDQGEVVISYDASERLFGGPKSSVGSVLSFGGPAGLQSYRVAGVTPRGFAFLEPVDFWRPTIAQPPPVARLFRLWRYNSVVARLAPGASVDQARAELRAVSARLARQYPDTNAGWSCEVVPLLDDVIGRFASASWMLLGAVACVLMVACANVAGLLLARATTREHETAVRLALGAGRWSLMRLWLVEGCLLTATGTGLGGVVAWWGVAVLKRIAPPSLPRIDGIALDGASLVAAVASAIVAVVAFGVASSVGLRDRSVTGTLGGGWRGGALAAPRARLRNTLVAFQSALAVVLVVVATLLALSFVRLGRVDLGWRPRGVLTMTVAPPISGRRPWYNYMLWADGLVRRLEATPGIERAAITTQIPLGLDSYSTTLARGRAKVQGEPQWPIVEHYVSDHYFETLSIRLRDGRLFDRRDRFGEAQAIGESEVERGVAIVSESVARTLWPGQRAIGRMIRLPDIDNVKYREVVGIVGDLQFFAVGEVPALHVFVPWSQMASGRPRLVVRAAGRAEDVVPAVRAALQAERPGTGIDRIASLDALVGRATAQPRFSSQMVIGFGLLALTLAAVGIYGTSAYLVGARTREIGLRIALGASPRGVFRHVLARSLWPVMVGGLAGLAIAAGASRTMRVLFFQVGALDARAYIVAAASLLVAAAVAALIPAVRASRIDPAITLRAE
jgi:putative ABC transport system permease protein